MLSESRYRAVAWCIYVLLGCAGDKPTQTPAIRASDGGATPPPAMPMSGAGASAGRSGSAGGAMSPATTAGKSGSTADAPAAGASSGAAGVSQMQPRAAGAASGGTGGAMMPAGGATSATPGMPMDNGGAPMPSEGCSGGMLAVGRVMRSIESSGGSRSYIQYVPSAYDGKTPLPMVIDLHGFTATAASAERSSGFRQLADTEKYIYIAPQGIGNEWDSVGDKDEKFIRDLVNSVSKSGCVDLRRIYATGCSNGGAFSFLLMCTAEDIFAAVAPMCGTSFIDLETKCMQDRPVSLILRIGRQDSVNCWEGEGIMLDAPNVEPGTRVPCAKTVQKIFTMKYHCTGQIKSEGTCEYVADCDERAEVAICGEPTGHVVYNSNTARDTYAFLKRHYKY